MLYVGTFSERESEGIYVYTWNEADGDAERVQTVGGRESPSFLALHPSGHTLYAVNRSGLVKDRNWASVSAYRIDPISGKLTLKNAKPAYGAGACYVSVDQTGRSLFIGNYSEGNLVHFRLEADGQIGALADTIRHQGRGPVPGRQDKAHVHAAVVSPDNRFVYAPDLGIDKVMTYRIHPDRGLMEVAEIPWVEAPPGTGPRHFTFHPNGKFAYLAGELNSTVIAYGYHKNGKLDALQQLSTLPAGYEVKSFNADIHVHPNGRFLYVSNRGHNSIAVFAIDAETGTLRAVQYEPTRGDWPRNFAIDPSGRYLLVGNRRSDQITLFTIDPDSGKLTFTGREIRMPSPVCLKFLPLPEK